MQTVLILLLFGLFISDEKTNIRSIQVTDLKHQIESYATQENLSDTERTRLMGILHFSDFIGIDQDGNPVNYSNPDVDGYRPAEVVIFGYYAEWCPNCRQNLPAALRLYEKYYEKGLAVVLNFMYSNPDHVREYACENEIPFPVLIGSEDREENPEVRLETTHFILRTLLDDYRRWGTPFYIMYVKDIPDTWFVVAGEFIESEVDEFLATHLTTN